MAYYHALGSIPHKRHTQFRKPDGGLYSEQLFSTEGFSTASLGAKQNVLLTNQQIWEILKNEISVPAVHPL